MSITLRKRVAASIAAASLILGGGLVSTTAAQAAPTTAADYSGDVDYFHDVFPGLREHSVFTAVSLERFSQLLDRAGTYAFLIGGPADPATKATISAIDEVAQSYGVSTIYTFDPRLDGKALDIRTIDTTVKPELAPIAALYTGLVAKLNSSTQTLFGAAATDPQLFIYNKDNPEHIVSLIGSPANPDELTGAALDEYKAQVASVFDAVATDHAVSVSTQSQADFFINTFNTRHVQGYGDASRFGAEVFDPADADDFVLQQITYPELINILEKDTPHSILFGGSWCHNTRAVIERVNNAAAAADKGTVYVFDLKLDGGYGSSTTLHIRDTASPLAYLYGDLVAKYFPNLVTQYELGKSDVQYYPGGDTNLAKVGAKKLQVPYLLSYDGSNTAAPIVRNWFQEGANGKVTEYMTELWWVLGNLPGAGKKGTQTQEAYDLTVANNRAFAAEGVARIGAFFGTLSVPSAPVVDGDIEGDTITASWTAPADGGSAITGYQATLDGGAPVAVPADATSFAFRGLAVGEHTISIAAVNLIGASRAVDVIGRVLPVSESTPSPEPTETKTPTPSASAPAAALTVTGNLRPGGSITVTGAGFPGQVDVEVELHSTPTDLGTAATGSAGTFALTAKIPTTVPSGAHTVVVYVDGVEVASKAVTLGALAVTGGSGIPFGLIFGAFGLIAAGAVIAVSRRRAAQV